MLKKIITGLFGSRNERLLKDYGKKVAMINASEVAIQKLKDTDFKKKTEEFKKRFKVGAALDDFLIEAFALVREASVRTIGLRHYDEQLMGGMALHEGKISEMRKLICMNAFHCRWIHHTLSSTASTLCT